MITASYIQGTLPSTATDHTFPDRTMNTEILAKAATQARGLSIDAVHASNSGHLGLPLGCAEIGAVLFGEALRFNPEAPLWPNRDRFVLSAGHGSMFMYSWLHLSGYDLPMSEVRNFRQLHSKTPGHPESFMTPGVECTTGPLGQGIGNSVGMAVSAKMSQTKFNTAEHKLLDYHIVCLAGDGCMQEGVASEASAFAGHFKLDNLILIYDANQVTLDAPAGSTQSEDTCQRYKAYGFDCYNLEDGHDMVAFLKVFEEAKANDNGRPKLIICKTVIGKGIKEVEGTFKAHGEGGAKYAAESRKALGLPEEHFYVSDDVRTFFARKKQERVAAYNKWMETYAAWKQANPDLAALFEKPLADCAPSAAELLAAIPPAGDKPVATRVAGGVVLQPLADKMPLLIGGSADLYGSTKNYLDNKGDFNPGSFGGRNIRFGIREHAMGAIMNGIAYHGLWLPSGATFLTFSDYMRPSIRLAALSRLRVVYVFTHDSVGVGEDGPTHQPVETVSALRMIPQLDVIRPADAEETAAAWAAACSRKDGPTALILSRQNLPNLKQVSIEERRQGTLKGGYVARKEKGELKLILLGTGSELQHAMKAAEELGEGVRVVSMPCMERFDRQDAAYKESVLPTACRKRIAIEAGVTGLWYKYVGIDGRVVGIDRFGHSAPGDVVMADLGICAENLLEVSKAYLAG